MKIKSWHISTVVIMAIIVGIFIVGSGTGTPTIGAILMLSLFPSLVWFGWTLHARALYRNQELEERVIERLRNADDIVKRRKAKADV